MQTKQHSFIESLTNVAIGYFIATGSQFVIFPLFDVHVTVRDHFLMGFYFTVVSIARSYTLRRWFNRRTG